MALQLSIAARNARLDAIEVAAGTTAQLRIYTGSQPIDCATADAGTLLATLTLPLDYMNAAATGSKTKLGTWSGSGAAAGSAGHFRIMDSTGTTCHVQGSVTATGGGGDMTVDNVVFASGQAFTVNTFTLTDANA